MIKIIGRVSEEAWDSCSENCASPMAMVSWLS